MTESTNDTHAKWWATWVIDSPWAHPVWSHYVMIAYDLTSDDGSGQAPVIYMDGATHEMLLFAYNPNLTAPGPSRRITDLEQSRSFVAGLLHPANYGYQMRFASDDACESWLQEGVFDRICKKELNPDTDANRQWLKLFAGAFSLKNGEGLQPPRRARH